MIKKLKFCLKKGDNKRAYNSSCPRLPRYYHTDSRRVRSCLPEAYTYTQRVKCVHVVWRNKQNSLICFHFWRKFVYFKGRLYSMKNFFFIENFYVCRKILQDFCPPIKFEIKCLILKRDVFHWNKNLSSGGGNFLFKKKADYWICLKYFLKLIRT